MDKREIIDRLQIMHKNCYPDTVCMRYRKDKGCDSCKEALNMAIKALDRSDRSQYWEHQAKKQAAAAGEIKIAIAQKLEDVRNNIVEIRHLLLTEDTALDQAILGWKAEQLERWARFLEDLLYTGGAENKSVGEDWKQSMMERFGRVE